MEFDFDKLQADQKAGCHDKISIRLPKLLWLSKPIGYS
jgi:hypothetical protein